MTTSAPGNLVLNPPLARPIAANREGKVLGRKRIIVDREKIRTMHVAGESVRAIAARVGGSKSLVGNILACK